MHPVIPLMEIGENYVIYVETYEQFNPITKPAMNLPKSKYQNELSMI